MERVVVALGGNALLRRGAEDTFEEMYRACSRGGRAHRRHRGGRVAGRASPTATGRRWAGSCCSRRPPPESVHPMPLDVCGAESQGQIGYLLQVTIGDVFFERGMERPVATVLTLTRVRPDDPAFADPTKFVGPYYEEAEARRLEAERGYTMKADPHGGWRRVVPSPHPYSIVETPVIARLVADDVIVIASGGGGVPGDRGRPPADRQGGRRRQGPRGGDPREGGRRDHPARAHRREEGAARATARSTRRTSTA